jgi:hypothetical protein
MSSPDGTAERIHRLLEPYIFTREEAAYKRRILAARLESSVGVGSLTSPLALVEPSGGVDIASEARGIHTEYLQAVKANIAAKAKYDRLQSEILRGARHEKGGTGAHNIAASPIPNPLEDQMVKLKLQRKRERLQAVGKHVTLLNRKPAASATFLDPEEVLSDSRPLPDVPREVVESLALGDPTDKANLPDLIARLEKQVLRAKLLLKREEELLDSVKRRSTVRAESINDHVKLHALNTTRTELINWMEMELSKVPAEDEDGEDGHPSDDTTRTPIDSSHVDHQLADIRSKYARYLAARKSLLQLVTPRPHPATVTQPPTATEQDPSVVPSPQPVTYLLTPYLERLLSLAREQKSLIAHKSHLNTTISRQQKETIRLLNHLADESNLLPNHPVPGTAASRRKPGFDDGFGAPEAAASSSSKVEPWVYAAESAKIATLEAVAEKIEEGQVALEGSMGLVREIELLLGRSGGQDAQGRERADVTEDDIWLAEDKPPQKGVGRKHVRSESKAAASDDLWASLDGNLGLLKGGDE